MKKWLFFCLLVLLTASTQAEELTKEKQDNNPVFLFPYDMVVGGGSGMFSLGLDFVFCKQNLIYESKKDPSIQGPWTPTHELWWTVRTRYVYDFDEHQLGLFLQPNLRYLWNVIIADATIGPEIGWKSNTGFDYGFSARLGLIAFFYIEIGHFYNSDKTYFNFLFNVPIVPMNEAEYHSYN